MSITTMTTGIHGRIMLPAKTSSSTPNTAISMAKVASQASVLAVGRIERGK